MSPVRPLVGLATALLVAAGGSSPPAPAPVEPAEPAAAPSVTTAPAGESGAAAMEESAGSGAMSGGEIPLNPRHPDRYVVKKGDTLWDISAMFLRDPWYWPEIWYVNPQVRNPHLIYPGDVLALVYRDGRPQIILEQGSALRTEPRVRRDPLEDAIPTIPYDRIAAFLTRPRVLDKDTAENAPYILTSRRGHLIHGSDTEVYVRGKDFAEDDLYTVVHVGDPIVDPDEDRVIGYEGIYVGEGRVIREGDPATMYIADSSREALNGDKLLPADEDFPLHFTPRAPESDVDGRIVSVLDGVGIIGAYQIVTLNRGADDGVEPGHVLTVWQAGREERDHFGGGKVQLPEEYAGYLMVFRTFDEISYGLIVQASNEIRVYDKVRNP
jgi:hypothetical protein